MDPFERCSASKSIPRIVNFRRVYDIKIPNWYAAVVIAVAGKRISRRPIGAARVGSVQTNAALSEQRVNSRADFVNSSAQRGGGALTNYWFPKITKIKWHRLCESRLPPSLYYFRALGIPPAAPAPTYFDLQLFFSRVKKDMIDSPVGWRMQRRG